jgi:hypothetical protein
VEKKMPDQCGQVQDVVTQSRQQVNDLRQKVAQDSDEAGVGRHVGGHRCNRQM